MIFFNDHYNNSKSLLYLVQYDRKYLDKNSTEKNFEQNEISAKINGLNSNDIKIAERNVNYFAKILDPILNKNILLCSVPPHDPNKQESGISRLIIKLCKNKKRINANSFLKRTQAINKIACGGISTPQIHRNSITVSEKSMNQVILLIDDIAMSRNSIYTCRDILLEAGAKKVLCVVLGYCGKVGSEVPAKKVLDQPVSFKISNSNIGAGLYKIYLKRKNNPDQISNSNTFCSAVYKEIYNAKNEFWINSGEIASIINHKHKNLILSLLGKSLGLPDKDINSFIGYFISNQMNRLGYAKLNKIDDHFTMYTPLLYELSVSWQG